MKENTDIMESRKGIKYPVLLAKIEVAKDKISQ